MPSITPRLERINYSDAAIVDALLPAFLAQSRITDPADESEARSVLGRAINFVEIRSGIVIASATFLWVPIYLGSPYQVNHLPIPVRGTTSFIAEREGVDVSDQYWITGNALNDYSAMYLSREGGFYAGDNFILEAGFQRNYDPALPIPTAPALVDVILRYAAYLWEFREAATLGQAANLTPDWFNESIAIFWVPRC